MSLRKMLSAAAVAVAVVAGVQAADITGKWTAQVPGRQGQTRETNFTFKQDGEKLTGTMSGMQGNEMEIKDGTVKGDDVAFNVTMSFQGNEVKLVFKGKVAGDEIKFTRQREGGDQPPQEFTAKRAAKTE
jgi:opacity protein-like surface antigen